LKNLIQLTGQVFKSEKSSQLGILHHSTLREISAGPEVLSDTDLSVDHDLAGSQDETADS
jgi:hypothetical protein